jgi:DNA repair protein RadC
VPHLLEQDLTRLPLNLRGDFLSEFWRYRIGYRETEVFEIAHFDPGMKLLASGVSTHSVGSADRAAVFSKEIVRDALKRNAYAIAFAHNHPSGDPIPSDADLLITKQLVLAATAAQIKVLDHTIVTTDKVFSFRKEGLL